MLLFDAMPETVGVGIFCADASPLLDLFRPAPARSLASLRALLPQLAASASESLLSDASDAEEKLRHEPDSIGEFVEHTLYLRTVDETYEGLGKRWEASNELYDVRGSKPETPRHQQRHQIPDPHHHQEHPNLLGVIIVKISRFVWRFTTTKLMLFWLM